MRHLLFMDVWAVPGHYVHGRSTAVRVFRFPKSIHRASTYKTLFHLSVNAFSSISYEISGKHGVGNVTDCTMKAANFIFVILSIVASIRVAAFQEKNPDGHGQSDLLSSPRDLPPWICYYGPANFHTYQGCGRTRSEARNEAYQNCRAAGNSWWSCSSRGCWGRDDYGTYDGWVRLVRYCR